MASLIRAKSSGAVRRLFPRNARHWVRFPASPDSSWRRLLKPSGSILVLRRSKWRSAPREDPSLGMGKSAQGTKYRKSPSSGC